MKQGDRFNPYRTFVGSFIPNWLLRCKNLTSSAKLCWARLAQYAGEEGNCFPSQQKLAAEIGVTERQINRILNNLEKFGLIERDAPKGIKKLLHDTTRYYFLWHKIMEKDQKGTSDTVVEVSSNSVPEDSSDTVVEDTQRESYNKIISLRESKGMLSTKSVLRKVQDSPSPIEERHIKKFKDSLPLIKKQDSTEKISKIKLKETHTSSLSTTDIDIFWKAVLSDNGYSHILSSTVKERNLIKTMIKQFKDNKPTLLEYLEYTVKNWKSIKSTLIYGNQGKSRVGDYPTITEAYYIKDNILNLYFGIGYKDDVNDLIIYKKIEEVPKDHPQFEFIRKSIELGKTLHFRRTT